MERVRLLGYGWSALALLLLLARIGQLQSNWEIIQYSTMGPDTVGSALLFRTWLWFAWGCIEMVGWALLYYYLPVTIAVLGFGTLIWLYVTISAFFLSGDPYGPLSGIFYAVGLFSYGLLLARLIVFYRQGGYNRSVVPKGGDVVVRQPAYRRHRSILIALGTLIGQLTIPTSVLVLVFYRLHWEASLADSLRLTTQIIIGLVSAGGIYLGFDDVKQHRGFASPLIGILLNVAVIGFVIYAESG